MTAAAPAEPTAAEVFHALGSVVKRLRRNPLPGAEKTDEAMRGANLAARHIATLMQISHDEPIGISELAERMHVSLATMSQVVTDLADCGLIERTTDPADRRRTLVSVATAHRPLTRALVDHRLRPLQRTLRRLDPAESAALLRGLTVLAEELDAIQAKEPTR